MNITGIEINVYDPILEFDEDTQWNGISINVIRWNEHYRDNYYPRHSRNVTPSSLRRCQRAQVRLVEGE